MSEEKTHEEQRHGSSCKFVFIEVNQGTETIKMITEQIVKEGSGWRNELRGRKNQRGRCYSAKKESVMRRSGETVKKERRASEDMRTLQMEITMGSLDEDRSKKKLNT